jgi:hypothetical protein
MLRYTLVAALFATSLAPAAPTTDPATAPSTQPFTIDLGHGYRRDDRFVWFKGKRIDGTGEVDVKEFARAVGHPLVLCRGVHAASFVALSEQYTKDKDKVYYKWISPGRFWVVELTGADPATFEALDNYLARDRNTVWRLDRPFAGADPASVEVIHPNFVWKDRDSVFYQSKKIEGADPKTFRHLAQGFYRDAENVYWSSDRLLGADANSFETFGNDSPYARDARQVWFGKTTLEGIDAATFRLVGQYVYLDKTAVYSSGRVVPGADPVTFEFVRKLGPADAPPQQMQPVLLRDRVRHYMFEPSYNEVYMIERDGDAWLITKQARVLKDPRDHGSGLTNGGPVTARMKDGQIMREPVVQLDPKYASDLITTVETGKVKLFAPDLANAIRAIEAEK